MFAWNYIKSWIFPLTYSQFITHLKRTDIPVRQRQDYFYRHFNPFFAELQCNKDDLHFVSDLLTAD